MAPTEVAFIVLPVTVFLVGYAGYKYWKTKHKAAPVPLPPSLQPGPASTTSPSTGVTASTLGSQDQLQIRVRCGKCQSNVTVAVPVGGPVGRYTCPSCNQINEFEIPALGGTAATEPVQYPDYWKYRSDDATQAFISETQEVKRAMQQIFDQTWQPIWTRDRGRKVGVSKLEVVVVQRNENPVIFKAYAQKRNEIRAECEGREFEQYEVKSHNVAAAVLLERSGVDPMLNEFFLFHGTNPNSAANICKNDFTVKFAGHNAGTLYGPGLYFAEASSKSDEYAAADQEGIYGGLHAMLLCRVVCGMVNYTEEVSPSKAELVASVRDRREYHSVVGDREKCRGTYREFIVFDNKQVYPEYVVIYRRLESE